MHPVRLPWERTFGSLCLVSSTFHSRTFSLCWFCFVVIIHHSDNYCVLAESFESTKWIIEPGDGLGGPRHRPCHQLLKISTRLALSTSVHTAARLLGGAHGDVWESSCKTPNPYPNKCTVRLLFFFCNPFWSLLWVTHYVWTQNTQLFTLQVVLGLFIHFPGGWAYKSDRRRGSM